MSNAANSQPQADGDSTPIYDLGTLPAERQFGMAIEGDQVKRLMHVEKSGPAFYRPQQPVCPGVQFQSVGQARDVEDMLVQSIQCHAVKTTGEVIMALRRCVLLDVVRAWPRLLKIVGVTTFGARREPRQAWAWTEMREAVELAICYAEQPDSIHWQQADATLRGFALACAQSTESRIVSGDVSEHTARLSEEAAIYRAFGEGRV